MPERRLISFNIDVHRFAVPIEAVREVVSVSSVVSVPGSRRPLEGIMQYRDNTVLPVFSLLDLLGKEHHESSNLVVVTGSQEAPVGFRVHNMGGVMTSGDDETTPYEGDLAAVDGAVTGVLKKTGGELLLLDVDRLFKF